MSEEMIQKLIEVAKEVRLNAYAPYSKFKVGAAVLGADGNIYKGCNIENASYGATVCAERTALLTMVANGCQSFKAIAVIGAREEPGDGGPCALCRQVMVEFADDMSKTLVISAGQSGHYIIRTVADLYPNAFTKFVPDND